MKKMFKKLLALFLVLLAPCTVTHGYGGEEMSETGDDSDIHHMIWRVAFVDDEGFFSNKRRIKRVAQFLSYTGIELQAVHFPSAVDMIRAIRAGECDCGFWGGTPWPLGEVVDDLCWVNCCEVIRIGDGPGEMWYGPMLARTNGAEKCCRSMGVAALLEMCDCDSADWA